MIISVRLLPALTLLLAAGAASAQDGRSSQGPPPPDTERPPVLENFEPIYAIVGTRKDETTARVQVSFQYRPFRERDPVGRFPPRLAKLHVGYTQTAVWSLSEESKPFKDTSYKPSAFYLEPEAWTSTDKLHNLALEGGYQHESNGKSGPSSRSIDILYVRPAWQTTFFDKRHFVIVAPKVWGYLDKEDNPDIQRYRGYFDLNLRAGRVNGLQVSTNYRRGTATAGAVQVDVSGPLEGESGRTLAYWLVQYFSGYGETLLEYNVKGPAQLRIGLAVYR